MNDQVIARVMSVLRARKLALAAAGLALVLASAPILGFPSGPPAGVSGAPGEVTCNDCHSDFPLNSGNGSVAISAFPDLFTRGYVPSANYTINVTVEKWGQKRWGFEMTALRDSNNTKAGEFTLIDAGRTRIDNAGNGRQYVTHCCADNAGTGGIGDGGAGTPGPFKWSVRWTAPSKGVGAVSFYAAGNAASNDNTPGGDWIYTTRHIASEDAGPPTVTLMSPGANSTLRGTVAAVADAADPNGISRVDFLVDGAFSSTANSPPYRWDWDTNATADGPHSLAARAFDAAGNNRSASIAVTVTNDWTPPMVRLLAPAEGAAVNSTVRVIANASDNVRLAKIAFYLDGALQQENTSGASPFSWDWDTQSSFNGAHVLLARATDDFGQSADSVVNVSVKNQVNDTTPPLVRFLAPAVGAVVSGDVGVVVEASDDRKLVLVQIRLDQALVASFAAPPFTTAWTTKNFTNGPHVLNATAVDQAGNRNWSEVSVTVDNDVIPPVVTISSPANGSRVAGIVKVAAAASDAKGAVSFLFRVDGNEVANVSGSGPHSWDWDTAKVANGARKLEVEASDAAGNRGRSGIEVTVVNLPWPVILTVSAGSGPGAKLTVTGTADPLALSVEVRYDGGPWKNASGIAQWSVEFDASSLAAGQHEVQARAWSGVGHSQIYIQGFSTEPPLRPPSGPPLFEGIAVAALALSLLAIGLVLVLIRRPRRTPPKRAKGPKGSKKKDAAR